MIDRINDNLVEDKDSTKDYGTDYPVVRLGQKGFYYRLNGDEKGPYPRTVSPVEIASDLGVHPQTVLKEKLEFTIFRKCDSNGK